MISQVTAAMKHQVLMGLKSTYKDEKQILVNIKAYLAKFDRTTSTVKKGAPLMKEREFNIKQYHWNLNKDTGTYFELFPNEDLDGRMFVTNRPEFGWLILVIFHSDTFPSYEKRKSEKFITDLLKATGCECEMLTETDDTERLPGGFEA